jgi:CPA1 family monovalent cation:H+ antiporter
VLFVGWAGLRGADSLVIALALPLAFPARDLIIFVTFGVIFATLVVQGLTLRPLMKLLRIHGSESALRDEEAHARRVVAETGLRKLDDLVKREGTPAASIVGLRERQRRRLERWTARDRDAHGSGDEDHRHLPAVDDGHGIEQRSSANRDLRKAMLDAEREAVIRLRDEGVISDDVMRRVLRDLDLETMRLEADDQNAPQSPYEAV